MSPRQHRTVCSVTKQEPKRVCENMRTFTYACVREGPRAARTEGLRCLSWVCTRAARLQAGMRLMHTEPVGVSPFQSHRREGAAAGEEQAPARTAMWQDCCSQDWALGKAGRGGTGTESLWLHQPSSPAGQWKRQHP